MQLLGEHRLFLDGREIGASIQYRKGWALLGYLAMTPGHSVSREHLAQLFWPSLPMGAARTNLRQVIASLNRAFAAHGAPSVLLSRRELVGLDLPPGAVIDAAHLEWVAARASKEELLDLVDFITGLGGSFLEGLVLDDCPEFQEWLAPVRSRLALTSAQVLQRLLQAQQAAGLGPAAIASAQRLVRLDPWNETFQRQLMTALAEAGHHDDALAVFDSLRLALETELGTAPSAATQTLKDAISAVRKTIRAAAPAAITAAASPQRRWLCAIHAALPATGDEVAMVERLTKAVRQIEADNVRVFVASGTTVQACVLARARSGDLPQAVLRAARIARGLLDAVDERIGVALCTGMARLDPLGGLVVLGRPFEEAAALGERLGAGHIVVDDSLFPMLFEEFPLDPFTGAVVHGAPSPERLWSVRPPPSRNTPVLPTAGTRPADAEARPAWPLSGEEGAALLTQPTTSDGGVPDHAGGVAAAFLTVVQGAERGKRVAIGNLPVVVGRAPDSDLQIAIRTISRHHCVVWRDEGGYRVRDLGATNQTRLNGAPVREAPLSEGDTVLLGDCALLFHARP